MKFTLSWLKTHLETKAERDTILEALTAIGLEVEGVSDRAAALAPIATALILDAKRHPNADRLQLCRVDIGGRTVEVVCGAPNARAGLKTAFAPIGATIPASGKPLKKTVIRGIDSNGMLCSAHELNLSSERDGILELPDDAPVGARLAEVLGLCDPVIEIAVTPNRADALGVYGIARDLAAYGLGQLKPLEIAPVVGSYPSPVQVTIDPSALVGCPYFVGRWIRGVRNGPSPDWLRQRLAAVGLRPVSALVDITNFIALDLNRPLHAFDGKRLQGSLSVRFARKQENLQALNGRTYSLDDDTIAVCDESGALSLGGIMGAVASGVSDTTTDLFLEAALFDPQIVARTGRKLAVHSDARFRFERGVDPDFVTSGIEIATRMILDLCGGQASHLTQAGSPPNWRRVIRFHPQRCLELGGVEISPERSQAILRALGCTVTETGESFDVAPPSWRADIESQADLVEEVLRIHGYHHIPETPLPRSTALSFRAVTPHQRRTMLIRRFLAARGLNEAVTWSFMSKADAEIFGGGQSALTLANPISSDLDQMRPTPLPNLLAAASRNLARGLSDFGLCEIGPAYFDDGLNGQKIVACGVRVGAATARHWRAPQRPADIFDAKADLLAALAFLGLSVDALQIETQAPGWYRPGQSGTLKQGSRIELGHFGALHPDVAKRFDIAAPVVGFELFLDAVPLPKQKSRAKPLLALSPFQPVSRDFAFLVRQETPAHTLLKAAREAHKTLIEHVCLFDLYEGEGTPPGYKSVAIAVTLQPVEPMTLEEIERVSAEIVKAVIDATGGKLRG